MSPAGRARRRRRASEFPGRAEQVPPMHSALKFEGKRLYELARRGESVERGRAKIVVHRICAGAVSAPRAGVRRALLQGHLHPDVGRGHRALLWARSATSGVCAACRSIRSATCRCTRWRSWRGTRPAAQRRGAAAARCGLHWTCRASISARGRRAELLQGQIVTALPPTGRASCGPMTTGGRFLGIVQGRRTAGSGRCGCSLNRSVRADRLRA